jgi:glycosyltransferase involved in cell wall biosynthesis
MKIKLHCIINSLAPQGAQNMLLRLLSRIDRDRFEPTVTSLLDHVPMVREFEAIGVPVNTLGLRGNLSLPIALCRLVRRLRADPPDIVQTWLYHSDLIGAIAARLAGNAQVVWNIRHSNLDPGVNHRSTLLTAKICARLSGWLPARIICCAEAARQSHVRFGYAENRFEVLPNGFDLIALCKQDQARMAMRHELGLDENTLVIGLLARFHRQKDHHNFILAAGLTGHMRLLGRRDDIPRLLSALDIATSSSLGEGFPNAIGEAMACEVPCVVTDVGDSASLVGSTGLVVPPGNPAALADAWGELVAIGRGGRHLLGEKARRRIRDQFSIEAVVDRYERLYIDLVSSSASRAPVTLATDQ